MGLCNSCVEDSESEKKNKESVPLLAKESEGNSTSKLEGQAVTKKSKEDILAKIRESHDQIIQDANRNFISSTYRLAPVPTTMSNRQAIEDKRNILATSTIDMVSSSPLEQTMIESNAHPDIISENRSVVTILNEKRIAVDNIDMVADEIAELVSSYTFKIATDDVSTVLVAFKPYSEQHR